MRLAAPMRIHGSRQVTTGSAWNRLRISAVNTCNAGDSAGPCRQRKGQRVMTTTPAPGLSGKSATVTGSTSGIGLGIAATLAAEGCNVMLNGFGDKAEIERIRSDLASRHRVETAFSAADMSKPEDIRQMVADSDKALGGVDILVNNAGIQFAAPIDAFADHRWDSIIAITLSAASHAIKA